MKADRSERQNSGSAGRQEGNYGKGLIAMLLLVALALAAMGYWYWTHLHHHAVASATQELSAIVDLKLEELQNWRKERMSDARFFSSARFAAQNIKRLLENPESEPARREMAHWLGLLKGGERYSSVVVVDPQGRTVMSLPEGAEAPKNSRPAMQAALEGGGLTMGDLHRNEINGTIELDIVFPIFEEADARKGRPIAAGLLIVDARQFLFPLVQSWPTPSRTAETLLVRREGNQVLFLNDLRHQRGTALNLAMPLDSPDLPAARVLRGETRVLDGVDYRGKRVVSTGRLIPGTPWAMVSKIDRAEVYAPFLERMVLGMAVLAMGMVASILSAGLLWRQRSTRFLQRELALETERAGLAERLEQLMRHANDIILIMHTGGQISEGNEAALRAYGYSLSELQKLRVHDLRARSTVQTTEPDLREVLHRGSKVFETLHRRKDGSVFPVEVSSRRIRVAEQEWVMSVIRDTTERKKAEEALRRSEARLAQAVQVGRLGTFEADEATGVLEYSPVMKELMGFAQEEQVPFETFLQRILPEDRERLVAAIAKAKDPSGEGLLETECRVLTPGGQVRWLSARAQTFFEGEGRARRPVKTFGAALDVTDHKESQARLERLVRERTARLQQAVEELEHFSYTITHDMRAPLRAMQGFAEMMMETGADEAQSQVFLNRIMTSAERMDHLIRDALSYTKALREELPLDVVDAGALLRGMLDTYPEFQIKHASIQVESEIPLVVANKAGLTQCFSNLLSNAIKFVRPGQKPEIRVRAERRAGWVRIWIEDKGPGIPEKMLPRLFQMFERGGMSQEGTGIGLALVRKVTERMGGRVGVVSDEERGSRFWVEFRSAE